MNIFRTLRFWSALAFACVQSGCGNSISPSESVLTQHNDSARTGVFRNETKLTPKSVGNLQPLYTREVVGQIAAQPLFVKGVTIGGIKKNVLYVATRNNYIYAFDVDNEDQNDPKNGQAWPNPISLTHTDTKHGLGKMTAAALPGMDYLDDKNERAGCQQTHGPVGITSTPVIDPVQQVMYVVFRVGALPPRGKPDPEIPTITHHILATIDIRTGRELGRTIITSPTPDSDHPGPGFDASHQLNRPGLLLMRNPLTGTNVLYIAFAAPVCDAPRPFDGWVFAYSAPDLRLLDTYITAPQTNGAGIWQSGGGLAGATVGGAVYATTGNNTNPDAIVNSQTGAGSTDLGDSILKLKLDAHDKFMCLSRVNGHCVTDHFTAGNWYRLDTGYETPCKAKYRDTSLNSPCYFEDDKDKKREFEFYKVNHDYIYSGGDSDLGSGGPVVLANGWVIAGGKQGRLYVLDPSHMDKAKQGFQFSINTWHQSGSAECRTLNKNPDQNKKVDAPNPHGKDCFIERRDYDFEQSYGPNIHGSPVVWQRAGFDFGYVYVMAEKDYLRANKVYRNGRVVEDSAMTTRTVPTGKVPPIFPGNMYQGRLVSRSLRSPDGMPGGALSLSANGDKDGLVWVSLAPAGDATNTFEPGILMAFDALTLDLLWSSEEYDDNEVYFAKFVPPTIAYGRVFRATFGDHLACKNAPSEEALHASATLIKDAERRWPLCGSVIVYGLKKQIAVRNTP